MKEYTLNELQSFIAVVETESFSQAADRLKTSSASISRRISELESTLGVSLLHRTTRKINLTEAGERYYQDVKQALEALKVSQDRLLNGQESISGRLRLAAPMSFGLKHLSSLLMGFMQQYPDLQIDLKLEDRETDLYSDGIDLALRIGEYGDSSLIATKLGTVNFVYCASPDYLEKFGEPQTIEELKDHHLLHYSLIPFKQEWGLNDTPYHPMIRFSANNGEALRKAALQGFGIACLPLFLVETALNADCLRPILTQLAKKQSAVYAVRPYSPLSYTPTKVSKLIEYLKEKI